MSMACDHCLNYEYDEDYEDYVCVVDMDEDEMVHFVTTRYKECPYFRIDDEYAIVRKQN